MMKVIFYIFLVISTFNVHAQRLSFNCSILKEVIHSIDDEKEKIVLNNIIRDKYYAIADPVTREYEIMIKDKYRNDKIVDSIINLPYFSDISDSRDDSLFYLKRYNVIVDTFKFFTPECSCKIKGREFKVVNSYKNVPSGSKWKLMTVYKIGNYRNFSTVSFKHSGPQKDWDCVMFKYLIEESKPVIHDVKVMWQDDY